MSLIKWRPMQHEKDLSGDVVFSIWKSKRVAWHWVALYRRNHKPIKRFFYDANYLHFNIHWGFRGRRYTITFMEYAGLVPRRWRWIHHGGRS